MNRTLILSCSQSKKIDEADLPAIQRYDGPAFRLLRRYLGRSDEDLEIYILSAKFGLIRHQTLIPYYEQKLQNGKVEELKRLVAEQRFFFKAAERKSFFVNLGKNYLQVFAPVLQRAVKNSAVTFASGSSGKRLAQMYDWLYGEKSRLRDEHPKMKLEKEVFIRGVLAQASEAEIRKIIQKEISENGTSRLQNFQSWFVPVGDVKVSPKWLVGKLTGLACGKFHSDEARKVLRKLGIKVERV